MKKNKIKPDEERGNREEGLAVVQTSTSICIFFVNNSVDNTDKLCYNYWYEKRGKNG